MPSSTAEDANLQARGRAGSWARGGRGARKRGEPGGGAGSPMGRSDAGGGAGSRRLDPAHPLLSPRLPGPLNMSWRRGASAGRRLVASGRILAGRRGAAGAAGSGYAAGRAGLRGAWVPVIELVWTFPSGPSQLGDKQQTP